MIDHDKTARLIRASKGAYGLTDADLARDSGLSRAIVNLYLNRRINLLQADVERLLKVLELQDFIPRLSVTADFTSAGATE